MSRVWSSPPLKPLPLANWLRHAAEYAEAREGAVQLSPAAAREIAQVLITTTEPPSTEKAAA